jgi:hypothetical protein
LSSQLFDEEDTRCNRRLGSESTGYVDPFLPSMPGLHVLVRLVKCLAGGRHGRSVLLEEGLEALAIRVDIAQSRITVGHVAYEWIRDHADWRLERASQPEVPIFHARKRLVELQSVPEKSTASDHRREAAEAVDPEDQLSRAAFRAVKVDSSSVTFLYKEGVTGDDPDSGVIVEKLYLTSDLVAFPLVVVVDEADELSRGAADAGVAGCCCSPAHRHPVKVHSGIAASHLGDYVIDRNSRSVVNDQNFEFGVGLREDRGECRTDTVWSIVGR